MSIYFFKFLSVIFLGSVCLAACSGIKTSVAVAAKSDERAAKFKELREMQ